MPLPPPETKEFSDYMADIAARTRGDLEESSQSLQEIALLVNQTSNEVDRLAQRELQLSNRVREMDANLEAYARSDIRDMLRAHHDVELRLLMMRAQLEQLQERDTNIRNYQEKLRTLAELAETHVKPGEPRPGTGEFRTRALRRAAGATTLPFGDVIQAAEDERLRVAQQIVDGPAQILANVILETEICERLLERQPERVGPELGELRRVATTGLLDARRMLFELRPVVLGELGVVTTLRRYLVELGRQRPLEANVNGPDGDDVLPDALRLALFRLLQGAVSAAVADPGVASVDVDVRYEDAQVVCRLEARGEGLDRNQTLPRYRSDETVRRRLEQLGAELQLEVVGDGLVRLGLVVPLG